MKSKVYYNLRRRKIRKSLFSRKSRTSFHHEIHTAVDMLDETALSAEWHTTVVELRSVSADIKLLANGNITK